MVGMHGRRLRRAIVVGVALGMLTGCSLYRNGPPPEPVSRPSATPSPAPSPPPSPAPAAPYRVVGLGDSVPAGTLCGCTPYVDQVGRQVAEQRGAVSTVHNLARAGLTTAGLVDQLRQSTVDREIADADLVIVTIGANDFDASRLTDPDCAPADQFGCYRDTLAAQRARLATILDRIADLNTNPDNRVLVTGYWNVFLDGRVGRRMGSEYTTASNALTIVDNAQIAAVSAGHGGTYVDIYTPFKGAGDRDDTKLLASDGDHPNAAGHALIAQALLQALK